MTAALSPAGVLVDRRVMPHGQYRCIVADPPWRYKTTMAVTGNAPGRTKQTGRSGTDYPTMTVDEIAALSVKNFLHEDGSHVYLWTTNAHIEHAWKIMRAWGAEPKQLLTWAKKPKGMIGFGAFSPCTEFCLFGTSARRAIHQGRSERTWWEWPRTVKHSEKPQGFFDVVEAVSPGPRLELFARRERAGWAVWGNEVPCDVSMGHNAEVTGVPALSARPVDCRVGRQNVTTE